MSEVCSKCGHHLKRDAVFCPNCGAKVLNNMKREESYIDLIFNIVYIEENGKKRLSKAKLVGAGLFAVMIFTAIFFQAPETLRIGFFPFFIVMAIFFFVGLIYYFACRGIGYLVRIFLAK